MAEIGKDFPQTREARKAKLQEIRSSWDKIGTVKVPGRGTQDVYKIPLQYLSYNPYNTRFLAQSKTLEKTLGRDLRDDDPEDVKKIEDFIWKEKEAKNSSTIDSLIKDGQLVPGVVTIDGVILSGNRRFRLLNEITRNPEKYAAGNANIDSLYYFEAAILPEELDKKETIKYESFYQYGAEDKADYDPIQKYIAAKDQALLGYSDKDIADHFRNLTGGKPNKIKEWLEVYDLMEEYLDYIGEEGIYTALEGREEAFLQLRTVYKSFSNSRGSGSVEWDFDENDLADLKCRFYDYIRMNLPTHNFRLFKTAFKSREDWKKFNTSVEKGLKEVHPFEEYRKSYEDLSVEEISQRRNRDYQENNAEMLKNLYTKLNGTFAERAMQDTPLEITSQILAKIKKLNIELDARDEFPDELVDNIRLIQQEIGRIKQQID